MGRNCANIGTRSQRRCLRTFLFFVFVFVLFVFSFFFSAFSHLTMFASLVLNSDVAHVPSRTSDAFLPFWEGISLANCRWAQGTYAGGVFVVGKGGCGWILALAKDAKGQWCKSMARGLVDQGSYSGRCVS